MAAREKPLTKAQLIQSVSDYCSEQSIDVSDFFENFSQEKKKSAVDSTGSQGLVKQLADLAKQMQHSHEQTSLERLNVTADQIAFNKSLKLAEEELDLGESKAQKFVKKKLQIRTEQTMVNDKLVHRECRDRVLKVLSYEDPLLRQDKHNRLTKSEQKILESVTKIIEQGKFKPSNLPRGLTFLIHQVQGCLVSIARTQSLIVEALHLDGFDTFKTETVCLQRNLACLRECIQNLEYVRSKQKWLDLPKEKKVQILTDILRFRPFSEQSLSGGICNDTPIKDMKSSIERVFFKPGKDTPTTSSKKRASTGETVPGKRQKRSDESDTTKTTIKKALKGMSKEERKTFLSELGISL